MSIWDCEFDDTSRPLIVQGTSSDNSQQLGFANAMAYAGTDVRTRSTPVVEQQMPCARPRAGEDTRVRRLMSHLYSHHAPQQVSVLSQKLSQRKSIEQARVRPREPRELGEGCRGELRPTHGIVARVVGVRVNKRSIAHRVACL